MYSLLRLSFIIFVVNSTTILHKFKDFHPFTTRDANLTSDKPHLQKYMLIPSIGFEMNDGSGRFTCILNGWYYIPLNPGLMKSIIYNSLKAAFSLLGSGETYTKEEKQDRLGPFFVRDVSNHKIQLKLSESVSQITSTDGNGLFREEIIVDSLEGFNIKGDVLKYIATDNDYHKQEDEGTIYLMKQKQLGGCSIISDIDDTIKISEVPYKKKLMVNTFKNNFKAVPGMSDVYRSWQSSYGCLIHYVSAMPSQLYYVTQKFLDEEKFPGGSFHMRHLKLVDKDKMYLIKKIMEFVHHDASQKHKLSVIQTILDHAPKTQQFTMVGDSGELDPEIYGQIARKNPDQIKKIFIRLVEGGKNTGHRFQTAFQDVPTNKWSLFSQSSELPKKLYTDDNPINENDTDSVPASLNNANILSPSLFYYILPILLIVLITV